MSLPLQYWFSSQISKSIISLFKVMIEFLSHLKTFEMNMEMKWRLLCSFKVRVNFFMSFQGKQWKACIYWDSVFYSFSNQFVHSISTLHRVLQGPLTSSDSNKLNCADWWYGNHGYTWPCKVLESFESSFGDCLAVCLWKKAREGEI